MADSPKDSNDARLEETKDTIEGRELDAFFKASIDSTSGVDVPRQRAAEHAAREVKKFPEQGFLQDADKGMSSPRFLTGLANWHPGLGSFQYLADCLNPVDMAHEQRLKEAIEKHPCIYKFCLGVDAIVMILVLLGLGAISFLTIYRTFGLDFVGWLH